MYLGKNTSCTASVPAGRAQACGNSHRPKAGGLGSESPKRAFTPAHLRRRVHAARVVYAVLAGEQELGDGHDGVAAGRDGRHRARRGRLAHGKPPLCGLRRHCLRKRHTPRPRRLYRGLTNENKARTPQRPRFLFAQIGLPPIFALQGANKCNHFFRGRVPRKKYLLHGKCARRARAGVRQLPSAKGRGAWQ